LTDLASWIDGRHLSDVALSEMAKSFAADPHHSLTIDHFLTAARLTGIRRLFSDDGRFEEQFFRRGEGANKQEVSLEPGRWRLLDEGSRASIETMFTGPRPHRPLSEGVLTHLKFQAMLSSRPFHDFLRRISGLDPGGFIYMPPRIFSYGHFIKPHSDASSGRRLCGVFYVNDGWRSDFGGQFRQVLPNRDALIVDPLPNRLLLFRPTLEHRHEVLPLTEAGRDWQRWAYSFWFGPTAAASSEFAADLSRNTA
jgi:hypothetical protein